VQWLLANPLPPVGKTDIQTINNPNQGQWITLAELAATKQHTFNAYYW